MLPVGAIIGASGDIGSRIVAVCMLHLVPLLLFGLAAQKIVRPLAPQILIGIPFARSALPTLSRRLPQVRSSISGDGQRKYPVWI